MHDQYESPEIVDLGSLEEMTLQRFNKIGTTADALTAIDEDVVGSFTPIQ